MEIDFILDKKTAFEVKLNPRESDIRRLRDLSGELGLKGYRMISRNFSELEGVIYGFML